MPLESKTGVIPVVSRHSSTPISDLMQQMSREKIVEGEKDAPTLTSKLSNVNSYVNQWVDQVVHENNKEIGETDKLIDKLSFKNEEMSKIKELLDI